MAHLVITDTTNRINIKYGAYSPLFNNEIQSNFFKNQVRFTEGATEVSAQMLLVSTISLCVVATPNCLIVDTINGVEPTDIPDLYTKLNALLG